MRVNPSLLLHQVKACLQNFCQTPGNKFNYSIMPKDMTHILSIQRMRQKKKQKMMRYKENSNVSLQVLGSGASGASPCLFVSTDHSNYIFNCGEGTQRLANEHRCKLTKLENIFITTASWRNLGGIPGMLLTIQDVGVPEITLHGPEGTSDLLEAVQKFVVLQNLKTSYQPINNLEPYDDQVMSVWNVIISKPLEEVEESVSELIDNNDYYSSEKNINGKRIIATKMGKEKLIKVEKKLKKISDVMCYICKTHSKSGTLSLEKCVDLGVTPGPNLGLLKAGSDIKLPDGRIVHSKDVCMPADPGAVFLVVECPTEEYLESFVNHEAFVKHQSGASDEDKAFCVFHFTPETILNSPRYKDWINKFSPSTQHIILNRSNTCFGSEEVFKNQQQLHLLHPEIFPLLHDGCFAKNEMKDDLRIHRARTMHTVQLRPRKGLMTHLEINLQPQKYIDEVFAIPGFLDELAELQTNINAQTKLLTDTSDFPRLIFLGTGSSVPNKVRNTSGILLRIDQDCSILLDCGEGTLGQLVRFYGNTEIKKILPMIKAIYVSHLHADHHIGLIDLLQEISKYSNEPVYLLAPEQIAAWLQFYHNRFEPILDLFVLVKNKGLLLNKHFLPDNVEAQLYNSLNVKEISTVPVKHCLFAYGVAITLENGKKVVYSGDTMPCGSLVELGQNCDLLIHEATMEDDLEDMAKLKYHSTTSQAINAGELMKSKFVLLTHFSQRYSKIPQIPEAKNVGIAYDNMEVKLSQLPLLPLLYPSLKLLYGEHYTIMEERATKRQEKAAKINR